MARSHSSSRWLAEHENDRYVKMARASGVRSRAVFKLAEIQSRDQLIRPGMVVVDLGAAPGGWSEFAKQCVGPKGRVIALDILEMEPIEGVECICGDFREEPVLDALVQTLDGQPVDLVLSDIAPNMSGVKVTDQARSMHLAELALAFANEWLREGGDFLVKLFQGAGIDEYRRELRSSFGKVLTRKPEASRQRSREFYVLARNRGIL